ncbi:hypothetical protein [Paraburkholderia sp. J12]|uniref:hypothetical protein n=1 Tax=Paraburkholderia sp. J12 TaxID=2805432 RepID=UPI002ABDA144|nr:hypothetical protein [Paraburkholderia sp. J12]
MPRWVLRHYKLFDADMTLPNGEFHHYDSYGVPCCKDCNSFLGDNVETPVSRLLKGRFDQVAARLDDKAMLLLFIWFNLLFIKTHLKDRSLPVHRDSRKGSGKIADAYDWPDLHHIHAVARAPFVGAEVDPAVIGSIAIFPVNDPRAGETFDWIDLTAGKTVAIRVGEVGIVAVLDDAKMAQQAIAHILYSIDGPLTSTQLRELAARMAVANMDLQNRPVFGTALSLKAPHKVRLWAEVDPQPVFNPFDPPRFGEIMAFALRDLLDRLEIDGDRGAETIRAHLLTGRATFIGDEHGRFVSRGGTLLP